MIRLIRYTFTLSSLLTLLACQKQDQNNTNINFDNKSYITEFELIQDNPKNDTSIEIISSKALIDPSNNDIELLDSSLLISNNKIPAVQIISGISQLNKLKCQSLG